MDDKEFLKGSDLSFARPIRRPGFRLPKPEKEDLIFMQIDVDQYTKAAPGTYLKLTEQIM